MPARAIFEKADPSQNQVQDPVVAARPMSFSLLHAFLCVIRIKTETGQTQYKFRGAVFKAKIAVRGNFFRENNLTYLKFGFAALLQIEAITAVPTAPPNFFNSRSDRPSCSV